MGVAALGRSFGKRKVLQVITQLGKKHLLNRSYELEPIKVRPKIGTFLSLSIPVSQVEKEVSKSSERQIARQAALLEYLSRKTQPVLLPEAKKACRCDTVVIQALIKKGLL